MTEKSLRQKMRKEWQDVRKEFHYPQLPHPELVDDIPNGMIDLENLEVRISEPFIRKLGEHGIEAEESLNEVLTHELTHFMKFPGSILNVLRLQKAGQGLAEGHKVTGLRTAFTEAQTNLYMTQEVKHPATARMRKAYGLDEGDGFGRLMYGLYQEVSGQDFGVELSKEERGLVGRLGEINFLDKGRETSNFRTFVQILKDYQQPQQDQQGGQGQGNGEGQEGQGEPCAGSGNGLEGFTDNQIREGLRQFAQECSNPGEYEKIVRQVLDEESGEEQGSQQRALGKRAGLGRGITELAGNFYTALAEKYTVPIRKKPLHKNGSLFPHSHTSFEVGDPITEVDSFSTPGILPGITKKWIRREGEVYDSEEAVPDAFIVIDSSESMPSPIGQTSIPVLGATAISNAYLANGSGVAVYNFSGHGNRILYGPSRNREGIHRTLRTYFNGGTVFDPSALEEMLKHYRQSFDMSVVSDMEISNLDSFVESILGVPQTHRVHLLYTEDNGYVGHLREQFGSKENVAILPLKSERDIYEITMGELKKSVR